ncbi:MAG TPA: methylated-DNA--[protein]-cysteine S-methyltransferase [Opitutaceae bacterium]|nr:methylated-DNA--[protein]-cysteine S-methyltransferase [Opitutaceae bacterium]
MTSYYKVFRAPVGRLKLISEDDALAAVLWEKDEDEPGRVPLGDAVENNEHPVLLETEKQLREYFAGQRETFALKLAFNGTDFQRAVWDALRTIPFGETRSYGQIAQQIGSPSAVRAVGAANGKNPISIIVPCHRVIGANGKLTGFAGGLEVKDFLLRHENRDELKLA